jgi:hypothetical protein
VLCDAKTPNNTEAGTESILHTGTMIFAKISQNINFPKEISENIRESVQGRNFVNFTKTGIFSHDFRIRKWK